MFWKNICVLLVLLLISCIMIGCQQHRLSQKNDTYKETSITPESKNTFELPSQTMGEKYINNGKQQKYEVIYYKEGDYIKENKNEFEIRIDEDLAVKIGDAVLTSYFGDKLENYPDYLLAVYEQENYYMFCRYLKYADGAGISVAIDRKDGRILGIY